MSEPFLSLPIAASIPEKRARFLFRVRSEKARADDKQLAATQSHGVLSQKRYMEITGNKVVAALAGTENFGHVDQDDFVISLRTFEGGIERATEPGCISPAYTVLAPSREVEPAFFQYLLKSQVFISHLQTTVTGIRDGKSVKFENFANIVLPVPDLATQRRIADFLDRETARIDLLIEKKQRFLHLASERWRAVLNHHIFPNSPDWDGLPNHWTKTRLKFLTDQKRPIMYGIVLPGPSMEEGPMIVKGGDVKPGRLDPEKLCRTTVEIEASYVRSRLKAGDLVISIRGGIGDIEIVPPCIEGANLTQDAARIAPRKGVDVQWLRYALQSTAVFHPLEAKSLGAAVRGINIFDLKRVYVPTPPSDEQTRIASTLTIHEQRLTDLKLKVLTHADRLKEYRSALITAAVTGQINVEAHARSGATDRRLDAIQEEMSA